MCLSDGEALPYRMDVKEGLEVDRRTAILGAACLALTATIPGSAAASGSARAGRRSAAPLPRQSPIDLRRSEITFVRRLPRIRFRYPRRVDVTLVNTGSPDEFATVRAEVPAGAAPHRSRRRALGPRAVPLAHAVGARDRRRDTPLEMHFVHTRADEAILVVAVFIEQGRRNRTIAPMFRDLPARPNGTRDVSDVRLRALLPEKRRSLRYTGSLTTPP